MHNPFRYGVPVSGDHYLARPKIVKKLMPYAQSGQNILLYGPRRFGKTSFLQEFSQALSRKKIKVIMVDVFPVTSHRDFLRALTGGLASADLMGLTDMIKEAARSFFRIRPRINVEPEGISLDFSVSTLDEEGIKAANEDTIRLIGKLHKKNPLMVFFDEFQKISEIGDKGWLEGMLRSEIQKQQDVPYLFCGSQRRLILDMFENSSKPFYHMATPIELPKFGHEFIDWLIKRLKIAGIGISNEVAESLMDRVAWSPNYAQMIAFHLVADPSDHPVSEEDIDRVLDDLCQLNGYTYKALFDSLSLNAQKTVRLAAMYPDKSPFSQEILREYGMSGSAVQAAIRNLVNKRVLDDSTSGGNLLFDDPLFFRWIQKSFIF